MVPKMAPYARSWDLETRLQALKAQMLFSGGSDVVCGKIFVGTLIKMVLQWFSKIPYSTIEL